MAVRPFFFSLFLLPRRPLPRPLPLPLPPLHLLLPSPSVRNSRLLLPPSIIRLPNPFLSSFSSLAHRRLPCRPAFTPSAAAASTLAQKIGKATRRPGAASKARVYADVNVVRPKDYWDYESLTVQLGL
ncbi:hypothetical protein MLD38_003572 [Melastoma candidum]|uniref:Uncharacterized protein n=1 Tax=Melastoma candidum TaxID=119954 RepID=A0ACB9S346_9MYRT|nr:hypothetical protein MLD38_003572 [Melastoma candidum]